MNTQQHRQRQYNLRQAGRAVHSCLKQHTIAGYLAGQVTYNLGEYPARFPITPTDYDRRLLREFADHGVTLIQLHEEWNDSQRRLGADKFSSHDPEGLRRFIELVHSLGMKIILYGSTGFFEATDPDFDPEWADPKAHLTELYFDYAECSPAHPGWRAHVLPRLERMITEYGIDGIYNDMGYYPLHELQLDPEVHISPAPETAEHDAAVEDMLGLLMTIVHKHAGILKIHVNIKRSVVREGLYDYLWVGEGAQDLDGLRRDTHALKPYVVPCPDMGRATIQNENDLYLHTVPYLQFPLRVDGRPCTGQRAAVEGVNYRRGNDCFWTRHMRRVWQDHQHHPETPPMYGWWDSFPGRPEGHSCWLGHLDLYLPMVKDGSHVWLQIGDNNLFTSALPNDVTASLFVNDQMYLVLANYGTSPAQIASTWTWRDRQTGCTENVLTLSPRTLRYFQRIS